MTKATTYGWLSSYVPGTAARKEKLAVEQQARQEAKQKAEDAAIEQLRAKMGSPEGQAAAEMLWKSEAPAHLHSCLPHQLHQTAWAAGPYLPDQSATGQHHGILYSSSAQ
jgi:hypothetical protein